MKTPAPKAKRKSNSGLISAAYVRGYERGFKEGKILMQADVAKYKTAYETIEQQARDFGRITGLKLTNAGADLSEIAEAVQFVSTHRLSGYRTNFDRLISLGELLTGQIREGLKQFDDVTKRMRSKTRL